MQELEELEQAFATQLLAAKYFLNFDLMTSIDLHRKKQLRKEKCRKFNVCGYHYYK